MDKSNRTITIKKTFNAPIALVWEAWSDPQHIAKWWNPRGEGTTIVEHSFKVGGKWKYSMLMPNGQEFIAEGEYTEITELEKIASTANFKPMTEGVEIVSLFKKYLKLTDFKKHISYQSTN